MAGIIGATWALGAWLLIMLWAIFRLSRLTHEAFAFEFSWLHWLALVANLMFMAWSEGYRGFQLNFSPRLAARAKHLRENPHPIRVILAPLFCAGYFHTTRRRQAAISILTVSIVILILVVHQLPQPWRGIIDAGVVLGLTWGLVTMIHQAILAFTSARFDVSPEIVE